MSYQHRKNHQRRSYQPHKTSIKDDYIDKQITVLHHAIARKLLTHPELVEQVKQTLSRYQKQKRIGYGAYMTWHSILDFYHDEQQFLTEMTRDDAKMRRLRRKTPFVGILTEQERQQALQANATADINNISVLF